MTGAKLLHEETSVSKGYGKRHFKEEDMIAWDCSKWRLNANMVPTALNIFS